MKKITDFIVNQRKIIIFIFIILSVVCAILSQKVQINDDITKYLPNDSETRRGLDIMEDEFESTEDTSSFNIMFNGLQNEEKNDIYKELESQENVDSVDYDDTEDYNKDDYTLYTVNVAGSSDSEVSAKVYKNIQEKYQDYDIETNGDIAEANKVVLPTWILIVAVIGVLAILIIMCESYIEPFLFLFSILIAILLNNGTNIIFDNVSNITSSISAILQLALSMDYSIMLMNRFIQEKQNEKDKVKAMKNALYNAFQSISSSSVTTIVGLVCLVFMSFTIGKDLGFVLAKGVLFSLISIFCVLPGLILMCDNLITKTKKQSPHIKLDKLGKFSNKCRYPLTVVFVLIFVASFLLKGNLNISYTDSDNDEVSKIFGKDNQFAIIYDSKEEDKVSKLLSKLEENEKVTDVLGYSNTINEELKYDELISKLNDLGEETSIEDYLLKIIFYKYYNPDENNKMTFYDFINFIQTEVYINDKIKDELDDNVRKNIDRLAKFTSEESLLQPRTSSEIAEILEIDKTDVDNSLIFYNSKHNSLKLTVSEFIDFINKDVLTDNEYASSIDEKSRNSLNTLAKFTNSTTNNTKMTSKEMANLFGMSETVMESLYKYYMSLKDVDTRMTLTQFSNFVLNNVLNDPQYASNFDSETIASIRLLQSFSDINNINRQMNSAELANLFGIDESLIKQLLLLKYSTIDSGNTFSISEFIKKVVFVKNNTNYLDGVDLSSLEQLVVFAENQNNINTTKMNKVNLANIFNRFQPGFVENIYMLTGLPDEYVMTPQEFISFVLSALDNMNQDSVDGSVFAIDAGSLNNLKLLKLIIDDSVSSSKTPYTAEQMSQILGISKPQVCSLYSVISLIQNNTANWMASPNEFVNLILANINNSSVSGNISESTVAQLNLLSNIMSSSITNTTYNYQELASFIGSPQDKVKSIYTLYEINHTTLKLTPIEFVNFVLAHRNDRILAGNLPSDKVQDLQKVQKVMNGVNQKYSSLELSNLLGIDKDKLDLLYGLHVFKYNTNQTISLSEFVTFLLNDVVTNAEYSSKFDDEKVQKLSTINGIMSATVNNTSYTKDELFAILGVLTDELDKNLVDLLYVYYGSNNEYDENWKLTIEQFINFLNDNLLKDSRFESFIDDEMRKDITDSKETIGDAKDLLVGNNYSRIVINTKFEPETEETFAFIQMIKDLFKDNVNEYYIAGDSPMAYEMSKTFTDEFDYISILTMIAIFIVVAVTFKSITAPIILVGVIQCAVYMTMGILSISGGSVYFIALLIVQSILMGSTIDYAILYTSYYLEAREKKEKKDSIIYAYNESIHTILTSGSILVLVTFAVGMFATAITAKICITLCKGTLCSIILILLFLPAILGTFDKFIVKKKLEK